MKKLNFEEMGKTLSRSEMKQIMAGSSSGCQSGRESCSTFYDNTKCYPSTNPNDLCTSPVDHCTYNAATSNGSCGG
ncbi:MAG TPA: hypothetical protein VKA34_15405 [Balneolales bacterium]|nr:hypothetical protein [Balneolales bacterium]